MNTKLQITRLWCRLRWVALMMIVPACLCAQDCPNLVGGTEFMPTAGHESDYYYTVGDMAMVGPMGNSMATSAPLADLATVILRDALRRFGMIIPVLLRQHLPRTEQACPCGFVGLCQPHKPFHYHGDKSEARNYNKGDGYAACADVGPRRW